MAFGVMPDTLARRPRKRSRYSQGVVAGRASGEKMAPRITWRRSAYSDLPIKCLSVSSCPSASCEKACTVAVFTADGGGLFNAVDPKVWSMLNKGYVAFGSPQEGEKPNPNSSSEPQP